MSLSSPHLLNKATGTGNINLLFLCHFLSTWNARSYEFATTLFIARAFPEGLSYVSWNGISTSLSIILFASTLGRWIDSAPSRLRILVTSICFNRVIVISLCLCWAILLVQDVPESPRHDNRAVAGTDDELVPNSGVKVRLFQVVILLGILERLSRVATLLSVERDWVPNLALLDMDNKFCQTPHDLARLNAVMSRIDLVCKLLSPIAVTYLMSSTNSAQATLWCLFGMNVISWPLECWTAWKVCSTNASLRESKKAPSAASTTNQTNFVAQSRTSQFCGWALRVACHVCNWGVAYARSLKQYFSSDIWVPSIAVTSLHFSVLSFSGLLTVFLLQSGFSTSLIMWGEVFSAVFELSSTFVFAWGVKVLSSRVHEYVALQDAESVSAGIEHDEKEEVPPTLNQSIGSSRLGMWAFLQMFVVLIPTLPALWQFSNFGTQDASQDSEQFSSAWKHHLLLTLLVILLISVSRLGRWTAVLSVQQLAQTCVKSDQRSVFAGTEASFASLFGLGHFVITMIWSTNEEFKWVALLSLGVIAGSTAIYCIWLIRWSPAARMR